MSLIETIRENISKRPDETAVIELADGENKSSSLTWSELDRRAREVAYLLNQRASPRDRILLVFQSGLAFLPSFLGCLYAGMIAVPAPAYRRNQNAARLKSIAKNCLAQLVLAQNHERLSLDKPIEIVTGFGPCADYPPVPTNAGDPALLQYTSGSTGNPRGVVVSHGNLDHNLGCLDMAFRMTEQSVVVTWLPFHHDMGLIGSLLYPLWRGSQIVMMPPAAFLQRPRRWLAAISKYGGTHASAPNFAYDLCVRSTTAETRDGLNLKSWKVAGNGAEPVREQTLHRFSEAFEPAGFHRDAFVPCYGLAESTLLVSAANVLSGDVRIVDPVTTMEKPSGEEGEIWISGPSVAAGYWDNPRDTEMTFRARINSANPAPYLRTGDLGSMADGRLAIAGRLKDLIIVRGVNHYPQDIEETVGNCHTALVAENVAAFSIDADEEERLAIAVEIDREFWRTYNRAEVFKAIRRAVAQVHDLQVHSIALLRPGSLPKTTSGKIQRGACREAFLAGELRTLDVWRPGAESRKETDTSLDAWLTARIAEVAGLPVNEIDPARSFADYALDSGDAVRLSGEIEERLGRPVSPTVAYDYPTVASLAAYLRGTTETEPSTKRPPRDHRERIAVVGMACRFPGASGPEEFRELLREGRDAVGEIPASRWDVPQYYDPDSRKGLIYTRQGAFLSGVDGFDAEFFNISPREAAAIDPQQRLWLEVAWEALENAGQSPTSLSGTRTGVFAGQCFDDYMRLSLAHGAAGVDAYTGLGSARPATAGRLSYFLGLHGPSLHVDTSCSSSAMAVHLACQSLRSGECDVALAGGVNLILAPESSVALCRLQALSRDGRSKTFDASADGYGRGEGCGVIVLKRLSDAVAAGDRIEAVIRASATNHDGHTNGFTAPSGPAQTALVRYALAEADITPDEVGYIEAHGTGTLLGDPIEINALAAVFGERSADRPLLVGSVKTNIGHLEGAAGIAGLIKAVMAVRDGEIAPHLHLRNPNPHIDWNRLPLRVPTTRTTWPEWAQRRIAGVSSFGMSGTNVHILVENAPSAPACEARPVQSKLQVLTLSARNSPALRELVERFRVHLMEQPDLADVCYTANTGRTHFPFRIAGVAEDAGAMRESLSKAEICKAAGAMPTVSDADYGNPERIAKLYLEGADIDWKKLYAGSVCRKLSLPTYPFQRRVYWINGAKRQPARVKDDHIWESELDFAQFAYLNGHRIHGNALMPVSAFIEMARTAAAEAFGVRVSKVEDLELHHPLMLAERSGQTVQVRIARSAADTAFSAYTRIDSASPWVLHATAKVRWEA